MMPRKPICASCLHYFPATKLPEGVEDKFYPDWDGYCDYWEEERDKDETPCDEYKKMINRRRE